MRPTERWGLIVPAGVPRYLLDQRVGFRGATRYDPAARILHVHPKSQLERWVAWLIHRAPRAGRLRVDDAGHRVLAQLPPEGTIPVRVLAHRLGIHLPDGEAGSPNHGSTEGARRSETETEARRWLALHPTDPATAEPYGAVSLLVYLETLIKRGALMSEPI